MSPGGETGRRKGLKIPRPNGRAGSSPAPGTIYFASNTTPSFFAASTETEDSSISREKFPLSCGELCSPILILGEEEVNVGIVGL